MDNRPDGRDATFVVRTNIRRNFGCPYCGVTAGNFCLGRKGQARRSLHIERWRLAKEARTNG